MTGTYTCVIVGAGPAGIGLGVALKEIGLENFVLLERSDVGASFDFWPEGMKLITPSFTGNAYGLMDLNSIALHTSPAFSLGVEHPTGPQYADYLRGVSDHFQLPIRTEVEVNAVRPHDNGFVLDTSEGEIYSRYVVWAAGEFQYPNVDPFPGAEHCIHNSLIESWSDLEGDETLIIGGYESGMDAAIHLIRTGKRVRLLDRQTFWEDERISDPSDTLSPYTKERLRDALATGRLELFGDLDVVEVDHTEEGYRVFVEKADGERQCFETQFPPVLATGFVGSLSLVRELFEETEDGHVRLSEVDESTRTPGLFLAGPNVTHNGILFCFIYKFRQRFAVIANQLAERLGLDASKLEEYRKRGMYLDDLSCCGEDCQC